MARRPSMIRAKVKAQKKSKTEQFIINRKGYGDEPVFTSKLVDDSKLSKYFTWYNNMCDAKEAKDYLVTYLKNSARDAEAKAARSVPDKWLPLTACWYARMWSRGASLPESSREFFESRLKETLERDYAKKTELDAIDDDAPAPRKVERSIQDRMKTILSDQIADIEEQIDIFGDNLKNPKYVTSFKMYEWLQAREVTAINAKRMHDFYNPQLEEIEEAYGGIVNKETIDEQLREGYSGYSKDQLTKLYGFYVMIVEDLELYSQNSKKERKPRAKKPMSVDKKLKDFKHLPFDNTMKLQSVQPVRVLGASELWAFNTKYNQLTVLRSSDPAGLDVHRTAITNFDPAFSHTKKLKARDVDAVLKEVLGAGKVALRNIMKNARGSDQKLQERMNENTLLLRVVAK